MTDLLTQVSGYAALQDGWGGDNSKATSATAITNATTVLNFAGNIKPAKTQLLFDGSVALYFVGKDFGFEKYGSIDCHADGTATMRLATIATKTVSAQTITMGDLAHAYSIIGDFIK